MSRWSLKNHVNSFRETDLEGTADRHGVEEVAICGAMSHMCVDVPTRAASDLGTSASSYTMPVRPATRSSPGAAVLAAQVHAAFMAALQFGYAKLVSAEEYVAATPDEVGMGHQVEILRRRGCASVARRWLDGLSGFYYHEPGDRTEDWEGELASGGTFWVHMMPAACNCSLCLKYSGLYHRQEPAVDFAARFESEFWSGVGKVPLVRVDEYLVGLWYGDIGQGWDDMADPVGELLAWLKGRQPLRHLLTADGRVDGPA